jgi:tRNA(Ile)-lysidine synthase TilS/MesJ
MQCSKCSRDAIVFQSYSGLHLCSQHIIADVEAKAKKMIRVRGWLRPGDHIAVLLSGDQSSSALLYFFKKLTAQRRDVRLTAISIEDGTGARRDTSHAKRVAASLDMELFEVSMPEESDIRNGSFAGKNRDIPSLPSFPTTRSTRLDGFGLQHRITRIAWGLCLDDAAGVVLECLIRGDGRRLVCGSSFNETLPRICPFIAVAAAEVSLYADLCGYGDKDALSTDQGNGLHKDTVAMLNGFTNNHPATKYALLNLGESLAGLPTGIAGLIQTCEWYGEYQKGICNNGSIESEVKDGAY